MSYEEQEVNLKGINYENFTTLDLETTVKSKACWPFKAAPEDPRNYIVMSGMKLPAAAGAHVINGSPTNANTFLNPLGEDGPRLLVGHNIKFDLKHLYRNAGLQGGYPLWDTAIAEYMISGQKMKFPSLNDVAAIYGLGTKDAGVHELWDMGMQTENIDPNVLADYLKRDVELTEQVYLAQIKLLDMAGAKRLKEHIVRCSTATWFYVHAEMRGLLIDENKLATEIAKQRAVTTIASENVYKAFEELYSIPPGLRDDYDPMTPTYMGRALFGEPIEITHDEPGLRILKNGQPAKRKRKITDVFTYRGIACLDSKLKEVGGNNQIKVPAELLATAVQALGDEHFAKHVLDYRTSEKLLGTYLEPISLFLKESGGTTVHPQFNLTSTNTGRTSCAKPNAQNMPPEVEKLITGGKYRLVKADFKQLQIVGLALVTKDPQLIKDLVDGADIHYETGKTVFKWAKPEDMNKETRRVVKNTNFGLIFGGSAGGIAGQTGVDKRTVQLCIDAFYARYPKVKDWHESIVAEVEAKSTPMPEEFNDHGDQIRESYVKTLMGRVLRFQERDVPKWVTAKTKRTVGFSPNEIVCYPVQGFTDGDLVAAFIVECVDYLGTMTFIPINMVHDSLWLLTRDPEATKVQLQQALDRLNTDLALEVPLKLDVTVE